MILKQKKYLVILTFFSTIGLYGCAGTNEMPGDGTAQTIERPLAEKIDIGGHSLFINCQGQGRPTVLIDGGAGTWSTHYVEIQDSLSAESRVCIYDRAGLGRSDTGPGPRTSQQMVKELHALLQRANVSGPLLYVGHSLGGYNARIFQRDYPALVAGMVLIESGHEDQWEMLPPEVLALTQGAVPMLRQFAQMADQGLVSREEAERQVYAIYRRSVLEELIAAVMTSKPHLGTAAEFESAPVSATQVPSTHSLGNLPLVVLSAWNSFDAFDGMGIPVDESNQVWLELQQDLAGLSSNTLQIMSKGTHNLHETNRDDFVRAVIIGINFVRNHSAAQNAATD